MALDNDSAVDSPRPDAQRGDSPRPDAQRTHTNRRRAESFGAIADRYDRVRPDYPAALLEDLLADDPREVLDVGCGTGKAARLFAARGVAVLGVEVDPRMAEVARGHGIEVETTPIESWSAAGRQFDLVISAQAWHWVEPVAGLAKVAEVLRAGRLFAPFWNFAELDPAVREEFDAVYRVLAPEVSNASVVRGGGSATIPGYERDIVVSGRFVSVERREYTWDRVYSRADWLSLLGTYSDHVNLPKVRLAGLLRGIGAAVDRQGGSVRAHYRTTVLLARRP